MINRLMSRALIFSLMFCQFAGYAAAEEAASLDQNGKEAALKTDAQKFSYIMGLDVARVLKKKLQTQIDMQALMRGIEDCFLEKTPLVSEKEAAEIKLRIAKIERLERETQLERIAGENLKNGELFLEKNRKRENVFVTASGLQYEILEKGKGAKPKPFDRVKLDYRAMKLDGRVYDSTYKTGKPITVIVNAVLPGWSEGLQLMSPGSRYRFFMPPNLVYGDKSAGPNGIIQPNETLVFEVEMLSIETPKAESGP